MSLLDLIFPKNCLECGKAGQYICKNCLSKVRSAENPQSIWRYEGVVRKAILKLKYNFAHDIASEISGLCVSQLNHHPLTISHCVLVPIPLHKQRKNWRGFNQASLLGRAISTGLGWEFEENLLTRPLASKQQARLAKNERVRNISGKFAVNAPREALEKWGEHQIIIFDDVLTTGATLREAEKTLRQTGFKTINWLTICGD